ncbi:MAG: HNH endonuclease [Oscillospiraceae bacterium]|nr:HNH endonuclease [Oscillospiraceae bacterium]
MADKFDGSGIWKRKREHILKRDHYFCRECLKYGRRRDATMVHHIKPRRDYPELALVDSNLISLCDECHNKMHPEKGGRRRG